MQTQTTIRRGERQQTNKARAAKLGRLARLLEQQTDPAGDPDLSPDQWREYDRLTDALFRNRDLERTQD